ncbi:AMFR protein-like protein [Paraphoma chrysanthemicola]|uniref:Coupling of ubiquitin conjugation to ER degradation protein 1 n=1 Tax=Paraphoma chrysanthemicola TaxID=798071 RepID=A0A8K0QVF2_9PLEO|nr:AMFR protein-like protein [Paraphoma chrysanthemicola]
MAEQSINIPQVLVFLVVSFLAVRWYFSKPSAAGTRAAPHQSAPRINTAHVDQIAQMFPQLNRRDIMWDLQRNGGNVAATTERALSGRGLDVPPTSFNPVLPRPAATPTRATAVAKPSQPDLITRYNLSSKLTQSEAPAAEQPKAKAWSQDRNERQANLQRRREEMILAARRKLEQQEKGKAPAA